MKIKRWAQKETQHIVFLDRNRLQEKKEISRKQQYIDIGSISGHIWKLRHRTCFESWLPCSYISCHWMYDHDNAYFERHDDQCTPCKAVRSGRRNSQRVFVFSWSGSTHQRTQHYYQSNTSCKSQSNGERNTGHLGLVKSARSAAAQRQMHGSWFSRW